MASDREIQQAAMPGQWSEGVDLGAVYVFSRHFNPERVGLLLDVLDAAHGALTSPRSLQELAHAVNAYYEQVTESSPDTHGRPVIDFLDLDMDQEDFDEDAGNEHGPGFLPGDTADTYRWILVPSSTFIVLKSQIDEDPEWDEVYNAIEDIVARWDAATEEVEL